MAAVEEFCMAAKDKWPNVLIQFEDFPTDKAFDILDHMRDKVLCFNGEASYTMSSAGCLKDFRPFPDVHAKSWGLT